MSELYRIEQESLTAIADEVRALSGTTELMSPDAIATNIEDANDEVNSQTGLLAQLATALEGKAAGGGGSVETCDISVAFNVERATLGYYCAVCCDEDGKAYMSFHNPDSGADDGDDKVLGRNFVISNVVCGSNVVFYCDGMFTNISGEASGGGEFVNATWISGVGCRQVVFKAPVTPGSTATFTIN